MRDLKYCVLFISTIITPVSGLEMTATSSEIIFEWTLLDYEWKNQQERNQNVASKTFIPENCIPTTVKTWKSSVFLTIPRSKPGVPATLVHFHHQLGLRAPKLKPYPSWDTNQLGDCSNIQNAQAMEILPADSELWVVDNGRVNTLETEAKTYCSSKMLIINLISHKIKKKIEIPESFQKITAIFGEIVVDPKMRIGYISNPGENSLFIVDVKRGHVRKYTHTSFAPVLPWTERLMINNTMVKVKLGIYGLALSPDYSTLYYSSLAGFDIHSLPTNVLQSLTVTEDDLNKNCFRHGNKYIQSAGMYMGSESLFYGNLERSSILRWKIVKDMDKQNSSYRSVQLQSTATVRSDQRKLQWPASFHMDDQRNLWVLSNRFHKFGANKVQSFEVEEVELANFRIWRIRVDEKSYVNYDRVPLVSSSSKPKPIGGRLLVFVFVCMSFCFV